MMPAMSRRTFVAGAALLSTGNAVARSLRPTPAVAAQNPLVRQRADAQIFRHEDGQYYMTASVPEYDPLVIRRSPTLAGLATAEEAVVWRRPATGPLGGYIWAPELHAFDGAWHLYFAAGDAGEPFHIRTYVMRCRDRDPLTGRWQPLGQLETPWDSFTLDSTTFAHRGVRYLCWAQKEPGIDTNSNLYLAPLASPTTLARAPVRLAVPTLPWEVRGFKVAEAPALLARNGRLFLAYSASATDARYCLGLLTAADDADIMDAASWSKSPEPVFTASATTQVFGPGHNSFTTDEAGRDILVYHGRDYAAIDGDPLFDPNRHTRIQRLYYRADGTPDFGIPVGNGPLPERFVPASREGAFLCHDGDRVAIGQGPLPASQFRAVPGGTGAGSVALVAIDAPDRKLAIGADGTAMLATDDGSPDFARRSSFVRHAVPGMGDAVRFIGATAPRRSLTVAGDDLILGPSRSAQADIFLVR